MHELRELSQDEDELLDAYFERAQELLRYTGSRDQFVEENGDPVPAPEVCMLNVITESSVRDIADEELRLYVVNNTDVSLSTLRKKYEVVRNGAKVLETRNRITKERVER